MKTTDTLHKLKKFYNYQQRDIFKTHFMPTVLKSEVSNKRAASASKGECMQEMSSMLVCLQRHEFMDQMCSAEISAFQKCQAQAQTTRLELEDAEAKGILVKLGNRYPSKYINKLLKQYPETKKAP